MDCITLAQPNHHSEIIRLWHAGWHDAHAKLVPDGVFAFRTAAYFRLWLEHSEDQFHVALDDEAVVGFVTTKGPELVKLYVAAGARGTGTATALLAHAERRLREQGTADGLLFCTAGNIRAQRFYEREGWILKETFPDKLWLPESEAGEYLVDTHRFTKPLI